MSRNFDVSSKLIWKNFCRNVQSIRKEEVLNWFFLWEIVSVNLLSRRDWIRDFFFLLFVSNYAWRRYLWEISLKAEIKVTLTPLLLGHYKFRWLWIRACILFWFQAFNFQHKLGDGSDQSFFYINTFSYSADNSLYFLCTASSS